jgi:DNA invertase Pin-like site-specific DNA recombinase
VSLSERIDTTGAAGKMLFGMLAVLAQFERDVISERTKTAMSHKRAKSERISGRIPYGFALAADGVELIPVESEQTVLKLVTELRDNGESLRAIADILTGRGIPTRAGKSSWTHSTVQSILARA